MEKGERGIIRTCWSYVEIASKHLQFICKTHKKNAEKVLPIEDKPVVERN